MPVEPTPPREPMTEMTIDSARGPLPVLTREGLLRVDSLLPVFFEPVDRPARPSA